MTLSTDTLVLGHRGAPRYCPENTLPSFSRALELGAHGLELDVQLTKDNQMVVIHDERIDRTTQDETGLVRDYTLAELKRMDFGAWFDPSFAGTRIPTLEEVFDLLKSAGDGDINRYYLDIELKTGVVPYPGLEAQVLALLDRYAYGNVQLSSFYHQSLLDAKAINPEIPIGALYLSGIHDPLGYGYRLGAQSVNPGVALMNPEFISLPEERKRNACHDYEMGVFVWTADTEEYVRVMLKQGVNGVITNRCDMALEIVAEVEGS